MFYSGNEIFQQKYTSPKFPKNRKKNNFPKKYRYFYFYFYNKNVIPIVFKN